MFLKGINLLLAEGQACPTRQCRFIEYEDLPLYNLAAPPACISTSSSLLRLVEDFDDKLTIC